MSGKSKDENQDKKQDGKDKSGGTSGDPSPDVPPTILVWTARLVSLGLFAAIIGYLLYMVATDDTPAQFDVEPDWAKVEQRNGMIVLPVTVINDSTEAVTDVVMNVTQDLPGEENDDSFSVTIPLMGEGERALVELVFETVPIEDDITFRISSYQSP